MQHISRMGQAARIGHCVKNPKFIPIHPDTLTKFDVTYHDPSYLSTSLAK
jgi:hypothetical protein